MRVAVTESVIHASSGTWKICLKRGLAVQVFCYFVLRAQVLCAYQRITLVPGPESDPDEPVQSFPGAYAANLWRSGGSSTHV